MLIAKDFDGIVAAIDRHTQAMNRIADALEKVAVSQKENNDDDAS